MLESELVVRRFFFSLSSWSADDTLEATHRGIFPQGILSVHEGISKPTLHTVNVSAMDLLPFERASKLSALTSSCHKFSLRFTVAAQSVMWGAGGPSCLWITRSLVIVIDCRLRFTSRISSSVEETIKMASKNGRECRWPRILMPCGLLPYKVSPSLLVLLLLTSQWEFTLALDIGMYIHILSTFVHRTHHDCHN